MTTDGRADVAGVRTRTARPLLGLVVAQSLGSFNDNAWKQVVALLAVGAAASAAEGQERAAFAQIILMAPLMLVSLPAAVLAHPGRPPPRILPLDALRPFPVAARP